jgi:putative sterol carrier protein
VSAVLYVSGAGLCLEATLRYISEREAFNRPLSKFQGIRHTLADLKAELEAVRQLTYYTCWLHNGKEEAVEYCSMAKLLSTELMKKMADTCLQYYGGYGYMDEYLMSRIYRDARVGTIVGGTSEIMREIIARMMIDQVNYGTVQGESARPPVEKPVQEGEKPVMPEPGKAMPTTAAEIIRSLPDRFRPEKAGDWETVFHFDISGPEGGQFTVTVRKGACTVENGLKGVPECVVKTSDQVYRDVELGKANAEIAVMTGKIKISDLAEMMRFIKAFRRLPKE